MPLKSSVSLHINRHLKGCLHAQRSPTVCQRRGGNGGGGRGGDCFREKGFYSIQGEKLKAGELLQCFVHEGTPQLVTVFHVELVSSLTVEGYRVKSRVTVMSCGDIQMCWLACANIGSLHYRRSRGKVCCSMQIERFSWKRGG